MTTIGRWSPNKVRNKIIDAQWVSETRYALELVKPSSVVVAGGGSESATVSALGSVDFANATSLSLNDVFSSGYDNYMIVARHEGTSDDVQINVRFRAAGSDASGSNYTLQYLQASSTTVNGGRLTSQTSARVFSSSTTDSGDVCYLYGPNLAQPTAFRSLSCQARTTGGLRMLEWAGTHSLSTAYDGITIYPGSGTITGRVAVYGMRG